MKFLHQLLKTKKQLMLPLQIDITNACNLKCTHCYHPHHSNTGALTLDKWKELIVEYKSLVDEANALPQLVIGGGEPTLSKNFFPILHHAKQVLGNSNHIALITNAVFSKNIAEQLVNFKGIKIQVSIDGPTVPSHDFFRGPGSFSKTIETVKILIEQGHDVHITTVLSKKNYEDIPLFFNLAKELRVSSLNFTRLINVGTAAKSFDVVSLSSAELKKAYKAILFESATSGVNSDFHSPLFVLLNPKLGANGNFANGIVIDYQGNYLASSRSRLKIGSVAETNLKDHYYKSKLFNKIRRADVVGCGSCKFYFKCGGDRNAAFAASGNYLERDPGCWISQDKGANYA